MATISTLTSAYRHERATATPKPPRTPYTIRAARSIGTFAARHLPAWAALRTLILTLAAFGFIDTAAFHFGRWVGFAAIGVSLLVVEALTGPSGGGG